MPLSISLTPGNIPGGTSYCFVNWQQTLIDFAQNTTISLDVSSASLILVQDSAPGPTQRGNLWHDTRVDRIYRWDSTIGAWVARHPYPPDSPVRLWWTDTLVALQTFDGGDTDAEGAASGPVWIEDTEYQGKFPLHVGTLSPSSTAVALNGTGGADQLTIAQANLPSVQLTVALPIIGQAGVGSPEAVVANTYGSTAVSGSGRAVDSTSSDLSGRYYAKGQAEAMGSGTAASIINPYRAGYWIKRNDVRTHYKAT
jgi:hypothetical protein